MPVPVTFLGIEVLTAVLFVGCCWFAWQRGSQWLGAMLGATGFGLLVEVLFVTTLQGYCYGEFLMMVPVGDATVPLWVALGWGIIMFSAMAATEDLALGPVQKALATGLLTMVLDLALDPIAQDQAWWTWGNLRPGDYFGVPYDNFIGWILIVGSYSGFVRLGWRRMRPGWMRVVLTPTVSVVLALLFVACATMVLDKGLYPVLGEALTCVHAKTPLPPYVLGVPAALGGYLIILAPLAENPALIAVIPTAAALALLMFFWPWRGDGRAG